MTNSPECKPILMATLRLSQEVVNMLIKINLDFHVFSNAMHLLKKLSELKSGSIPISYPNLLLTFLKYSYLFSTDLILEYTNFFNDGFQLESTAKEAAKSCLLDALTEKYFFDSPSLSNAQFIYMLFFNNIHSSFFTTFNCKQYLTTVFNHIKINLPQDEEIKKILTFIISSLSCILSKTSKGFTQLFNNLDGFNAILEVTSDFEVKDKVEIFVQIILCGNDDKSPPPNSFFFLKFHNLYAHDPQIQCEFFNKILQIVKADEKIIVRMNEIVPMRKWFESKMIKIESALEMMKIVNRHFPDQLPQILPNYFWLLKSSSPPDICYIDCLRLMESLFSRRLISLSFIISQNFLDVFLISTPNNTLIKFFEKSPMFIQLTLDVLSHEKGIPMRDPSFMTLIQMYDLFNDHDNFFPEFSLFL